MDRKISCWRFFAPAIVGLVLLLGGYVLLSGFMGLMGASKKEWQGPADGLWYCKELQLQLCFQSEIPLVEDGQVSTHSYAIIDDVPVMCMPENEGTYGINVINQDPSAGNNMGKKLFEGTFVSLEENEYIVSNENGENIVFTRVKSFSLQEKLDSYKIFITHYNGVENVGDTQHVLIASQKAKELWKTQLQSDAIDDEIMVAFDVESECWLISQGTLVALIKTNGNVIGAFYSTD